MMDTPNADQRARWNEELGQRWVRLADRLERGLREVGEAALELAAPKPGEAVLEIGCGVGTMAIRLARAVSPGGRVVAVDISKPMIEAAMDRAREAGVDVTFRLADAQTEAFEPAAFDLAFSRFGVMFFDDPAAAFANIRSAVRPGGRVAFACWAPLARNPHWDLPLAVAVRHLGEPEARPLHAPGPMAFDDPDYVRDVLRRGGWDSVAITERQVQIIDAPVEAALDGALEMGPARALIEERQADGETVAAIRAELAEVFAREAEGGRVRLAGTIFLASAART